MKLLFVFLVIHINFEENAVLSDLVEFTVKLLQEGELGVQ
jgi:hypothetical protein